MATGSSATAETPQPNLRWYRLTPDRLVVGLLAVEGFLVLSEWFGWFAFNRQTWTVLIALAAVGLALVVMFLWFVAALLLRRRFQYGLRSLMLLVVAVAVECSWVSVRMERARKQKEAVEAIRRLGGTTEYSYQRAATPDAAPPGPSWLRRFLGDDFFADVAVVSLDHTKVTDGGLESIGALPHLQQLYLYDTRITDAGVERIKRLTQLRRLWLGNTQVTDVGLKHLTGLTKLIELSLLRARITDAGLEHLGGLTQLPNLYLDDTPITDAGLKHLERLFQLEKLYLDNTQITDAGLEHLKGLTRLRCLGLKGTKVTADGVKKLQQALPNCWMIH
jgi:hypothetical protein